MPLEKSYILNCVLKKYLTNLYEDSEEDHDHGGGDKHSSLWDMVLVEQQGQAEGDTAPQSAVRHDELVDGGQTDQPALVHDEGQEDHTLEKEQRRTSV